MQLLTILSLIYLGILVLALVVSLVLILYYLVRVRSILSRIGDGLGRVEHQTQPLQARLDELKTAVAQTTDQVAQARDSLIGTG